MRLWRDGIKVMIEAEDSKPSGGEMAEDVGERGFGGMKIGCEMVWGFYDKHVLRVNRCESEAAVVMKDAEGKDWNVCRKHGEDVLGLSGGKWTVVGKVAG